MGMFASAAHSWDPMAHHHNLVRWSRSYGNNSGPNNKGPALLYLRLLLVPVKHKARLTLSGRKNSEDVCLFCHKTSSSLLVGWWRGGGISTEVHPTVVGAECQAPLKRHKDSR